MKKKLLSLLIVGVMMLGLMPNAFAAAGLTVYDAQTNFDAYAETVMIDCYSTDETAKRNTTEGIIACKMSGHNVRYRDMNFGTKMPRKLMLTYATNNSSGGTIHFRAVDPSATGTNLHSDATKTIATAAVPKTGGWAKFVTVEIDVTNPSLCTGVKDIYVVDGSGNINAKAFRFEWQYETITGPEIDTAEKKATASIERLKETPETRQAKLLLAGYDANGAMVELKESASKAISNDGVENEFDATLDDAASGYGAYFWYNDDTNVKDAVFEGVTTASGILSTEEISASADNGWVTISGSGAANETVRIAVVPTSYNTSQTMYSQSASILQLYETKIEDGTYNYKFKMPSAVETGTYKAVVKGATVNESVDFAYTNPDDIYNVLLALSTAATADDAVTTIKNNADIFGITAEMLDNIQPTEKTQIKTVVDNFFSNNSLSNQISGDYSSWTNGLKEVIPPEAVVSYIKNVKNVAKSIDYINKYKNELGISSNTKYTTYFAECKESIVSALIANSASLTTDNFVTLFEEAVVVGHFNSAESWGQSGEAFETFVADLKLATSAVTEEEIGIYRSLINTAKQELMNKFKNTTFKTIDDIASLFKNNILFYNKDEYKTKSKYELEPSKVQDGDEFTMEVWHENKAGEEETTTQKAFEDLDSVVWAKASINEMRARGVVNGKSDTMFAPNDSITREEFAAIVVRAFGLGAGDANSVSFADVNKGAWYAPYIAKAADRGIVNGMENNTFGVGQNVTREQIAAMLARAVKATNKNIIPKKSRVGFADFAYISDYAYDAVSTLAKAEIINGTGKDNFSPKKSATRAEAVVMLHRLLTNIK